MRALGEAWSQTLRTSQTMRIMIRISTTVPRPIYIGSSLRIESKLSQSDVNRLWRSVAFATRPLRLQTNTDPRCDEREHSVIIRRALRSRRANLGWTAAGAGHREVPR
jgi:hypothetical protein